MTLNLQIIVHLLLNGRDLKYNGVCHAKEEQGNAVLQRRSQTRAFARESTYFALPSPNQTKT